MLLDSENEEIDSKRREAFVEEKWFQFTEQVLSSRCILNMKRLLFWEDDPFKISSKKPLHRRD